MVKMNEKGILYWLSPNHNILTGRQLEYEYSVVDCKPGYAKLTRHNYSIIVSIRALYAFKQGSLVQDAFPELSATDREFLITGLNPTEQAKLFGPEEPCTQLSL